MLSHGAVLRSSVFSDEQVEAIARDYRTAGLSTAEVAMMAFAQKVTLNAYRVVPEDVEGLRRHGFSDQEILDIVLTAAARSFYSKALDAIGATPLWPPSRNSSRWSGAGARRRRAGWR